MVLQSVRTPPSLNNAAVFVAGVFEIAAEISYALFRYDMYSRPPDISRFSLVLVCICSGQLAACSAPAHDKAMDLAQCRLDEGSLTGKRKYSIVRSTTDFITTCMRGKGWQAVHSPQAGTVCTEVMLAPLDDACYERLPTP